MVTYNSKFSNLPFHSFLGMTEDMQDYGVYADAVDIVFDEEELDDSDDEEDHHANENNAHQSRNLTDTQ
jgi:hypothetical protein